MARYDDEMTLEQLVEEARDWTFYHERHPDAWQGAEWAEELLTAIAALAS